MERSQSRFFTNGKRKFELPQRQLPGEATTRKGHGTETETDDNDNASLISPIHKRSRSKGPLSRNQGQVRDTSISESSPATESRFKNNFGLDGGVSVRDGETVTTSHPSTPYRRRLNRVEKPFAALSEQEARNNSLSYLSPPDDLAFPRQGGMTLKPLLPATEEAQKLRSLLSLPAAHADKQGPSPSTNTTTAGQANITPVTPQRKITQLDDASRDPPVSSNQQPMTTKMTNNLKESTNYIKTLPQGRAPAAAQGEHNAVLTAMLALHRLTPSMEHALPEGNIPSRELMQSIRSDLEQQQRETSQNRRMIEMMHQTSQLHRTQIGDLEGNYARMEQSIQSQAAEIQKLKAGCVGTTSRNVQVPILDGVRSTPSAAHSLTQGSPFSGIMSGSYPFSTSNTHGSRDHLSTQTSAFGGSLSNGHQSPHMSIKASDLDVDMAQKTMQLTPLNVSDTTSKHSPNPADDAIVAAMPLKAYFEKKSYRELLKPAFAAVESVVRGTFVPSSPVRSLDANHQRIITLIGGHLDNKKVVSQMLESDEKRTHIFIGITARWIVDHIYLRPIFSAFSSGPVGTQFAQIFHQESYMQTSPSTANDITNRRSLACDRSAMARTLVEQPGFWRWVHAFSQQITRQFLNEFGCLIPARNASRARVDLEKAIDEHVKIAIRMRQDPTFFDIKLCRYGVRWDHKQMVQRNPELQGHACDQSPSPYAVLFAVAPAVDQKIFTANGLQVKTVMRGEVILGPRKGNLR